MDTSALIFEAALICIVGVALVWIFKRMDCLAARMRQCSRAEIEAGPKVTESLSGRWNEPNRVSPTQGWPDWMWSL
jgi:hypothetical protein